MAKIRGIELFAGAGGMAIGAESAGIEHVMLNEIDKNPVNTLKRNRKDWNIVHKSIDDILIDSKKYKGIDIVSGGFPCQSFSYAGKGMGLEDARGTLFFSYANFIKFSKPKVFLIENVQGLVSHDNGRTFKIIINTMEKLGYFIKYKVLNSNNYGVAQKRKRIFIVGFRSKVMYEKFQFPKENDYKPVLRDVIYDLPKSEGYEYSEYKYNILKLVPPGGCWRDLPDEIAREYMKGSYHLGGGKTGIARRLSWDEPSLTLTTSPMQKQTERCHPLETRPFNILEYSRIQSFPSDWIFEGSLNSKYKQIGNAVPPKMAEAVFKEIVKTFKG